MPMLIDQIKTGDHVDISTSKLTKIDWTKAYSSRVEAVISKDKVLVLAPLERGVPVRLPAKESCQLRFSTDRGILLFGAAINEFRIIDRIQILSLKLKGDGEKVQRRNFFRFNCSIPIFFYPLNENGEPLSDEPQEGIVRDIGGGGMRMLSKHLMSTGIIIRTMLQLDGESIMAFGHVLRRENNQNAMYSNQYHIKFAAMSTTDQDKIIQYIYNQQRKNLQRS